MCELGTSSFNRGRLSAQLRLFYLSSAIVSVYCGIGCCATVPTVHFDNYGDNANLSEAILTPSTLQSGHFGKLGSYVVNGYVFAQPLYIPRVRVSGRLRSVIVVATMSNNIYAFDANLPGSEPLWGPVSFGPPNTKYPGYATGMPFLYSQGLGCLSTPAADAAAGALYTVCMNDAREWVLRVQSLATGTILRSITIQGEVHGTGDPSGGDAAIRGTLHFKPSTQLQRPGLRIASGNVYVAFGGIGDTHPWHGWLIGYDSDLHQTGIWCSTPNSFGGAIWGGEPSIDGMGNLYVSTGNGGKFDSTAESFTNSLVKLSPNLRVIDWFEPPDNELLNTRDADLGANRTIQIAGTNLIVVAGKDFNVYILDKSCLGHLYGSSNCKMQTFKTDQTSQVSLSSGSYGGTFMNNVLYLPLTNGPIFAFALKGKVFDPQPIASHATNYGPWGPAQMGGSSNGPSNGILWITTSSVSAFAGRQEGTLRALDAKTLAELWNSGQNERDALGSLSKFSSPTVADGHVFVADVSGSISVYGLARNALVARK